jgi:hypothetical protein
MARTLDGYPTPFGSSLASVNGIAGPEAYVQVAAGTAPAVATGGQTIYPRDFGMKYFDFLTANLTDTALNRVECIPGEQSAIGPKGTAAWYTLRWEVVSTAAEVEAEVDLSSEIVRILAIGPK